MSEPFIFANGQVANDAEDLIKLCREFPDDSLNYLIREDFEKWLSYIGATKFAEYAKEARQASVADTQKLELFIAKSQPQPTTKTAVAPPQTPAQPKFNLFTAIANFLGNNTTKSENNPANT